MSGYGGCSHNGPDASVVARNTKRLRHARENTRQILRALDLLEGDPLVDINYTRRIDTVVVNGRLVDRAEPKRILDWEAALRSATAK